MVLSQISNKFHKFQQITKQGKEMYKVRQMAVESKQQKLLGILIDNDLKFNDYVL